MIQRDKIVLQAFILPYSMLMLFTGILLMFTGRDRLFLILNEVYHPLADQAFKYITYLGDGWLYLIIIIVFAFISKRWCIHAAAAFLFSFIVSRIGKDLIFEGMHRPKKYFEGTDIVIRTIDGLRIHEYDTFPSGHTVTAFSMFLILSLYFNRSGHALFFLILAVLAGYSRIYLSQHFPSDVYFGSLTGVVISWISYSLIENYRKRHPQKLPDLPLINLQKNG
jgi:membrane-associated phospholipid phosphatase